MTSKDPDQNPTRHGAIDPKAHRGEAEDRTVPSLPAGSEEERTVPSGTKAPAGTGGPKGKRPPAPGKRPQGPPPPTAGTEEQTVHATESEAKHRAEAVSGDLIGKVIGGCRIDKMLGRGAMGAVYKARQLKLDRDVAVKVIRPEMMTDPRTLKRFEVEARTVGKFNSAHVVMVHDVGFELGVHYLVMEFVQGKNLREHVKLLAGGRLPAGEALPLIRQSCKGLEEARRLGVVHRDIKPDNLMLTDQGVLKIADFGIAKPMQDDFHMTMTSELIGTPLYMSPEQCQGGADIDFRSDMYSLGATFFYLLTGEPPIRASSVYELIQTKTKLEHLCLWKSLPELDENHPLSRVIERMTANDREDRYGSYEELLNDLLLVEAGETITVKPKRAKKPVPVVAAAAEKKGVFGLIALVTIVLLGAGGGYWWYTGQDKIGNPPLDGGGTLAEATQNLKQFRQRLRDNGPDVALRAAVAKMPVPTSLASEHDRLLKDVDAGLAVAAGLQAAVKPTDLQLPFDDLCGYLSAVDGAAAIEPAAGAEVRVWLQRRVADARAERELGAMATAHLLARFAQWQGERGKAAGDARRIAGLGPQLAAIETGRRTIIDRLPAQRETLDRDLPVTELDKARRGLTETGPERMPDVDVGESLAAYRAKFVEQGPLAALISDTEKLQPTRTDQLEEKSSLLNEMDAARTAADLARNKLRPTAPQPPFDEVVTFFAQVDEALEPLRTASRELPTWAALLRTDLLAKPLLQKAVVDACGQRWSQWQERRKAGASTSELERTHQELRGAVQRAGEIFPDAKDELARMVPPEALRVAMAEVMAEAARATWLAAMSKANGTLAAIGSFDEWRLAEAGLAADAAALRASLTGSVAAEPALARQLQQLDSGCESWRTQTTRFAQAAELLAAGNLTACDTAVKAAVAVAEGQQQFRALQEIVGHCRRVFEGLERGPHIDAAKAELVAARSLLSSTILPASVGIRIESWQRGLVKLDEARLAGGMVPIPAGETKNPREKVPAFFMAATECSQADFAAFQAELSAMGSTDAERLAAVQSRLPAVGLTEAMLKDLLDVSTSKPRLPVDRVSWHHAVAYCRFHGMDLPTLAEWSLAAFGDGKQHVYPWGDEWSNEKQDRNPSTGLLAEVDAGGLSWRAKDGHKLHHLAGNVAEWLSADASVAMPGIAGGRYTQGMTASAKEQASGARLETRRKEDDLSGVGFRAVLRPREFGELSWPR